MSKFQHLFLRIFVFWTGMIVLVLELTASRLLAPYFGSSIFVWANIIGIILLALSLGYWVGGKLADRWPEYALLMKIVFFSGLLVALIPLLFRLVAPVLILSFADLNTAVIIASFLSVLILFFGPAFLLAMVSPFGVRLATKSVATTGQAAGSLYAWSTAGSILGTFITAFLAVPYIGTIKTILLCSVILIILSAVGLRRFVYLSGLLLPLLIYLILSGSWIHPRSGAVYEKESPYQYIQVVDTAEERQLITDSGFGVQSLINKKNLLTGHYYDLYALLPPNIKQPGGKLDVLILGLGGGVISHLYDQIYSDEYNISLTGVDIDSDLIEAGKDFFGLSNQPVDIVIADARVFLNQNSEVYDVIIIDAYQNQLNIPFHLATEEFFEEVISHLTPTGIAAVNFHAPEKKSAYLKMFSNTLASVFERVYRLQRPDSFNYMLVGSRRELDFGKTRYPNEINNLATAVIPQIELYRSDGPTKLTDDLAPVELLTESEYISYIWRTRN